MEPVVCPVCGLFTGYVPNGWEPHVVHNGVSHSLTTERPPPPDPNLD